MSIYVGDKKFDLHYTTTGNKVNRSVFKGENKLWPLYEFSFYDGSMQKNIENIPAAGTQEKVKIRTCEDSWWHKLKFDEIYVFDKELSKTWLRYNAINLNCQKNPIKTHWLSVIKENNYNVNPENSDDKQTISFSDHYNNISGGTCVENLHDIDMKYKIDTNDWFVSRSGYMYGKQYDEWDHISGTTKKDYHFYNLSPSDNTPIIYISQVANSWYNSAENKEFEQIIEFSCKNDNENENKVILTWKIYSKSSSGTTIYYGSNIASNNGTVETFGEVYAEDYMWITVSNPNIKLDINSVEKSISSNGEVTWTMSANWDPNDATGSNASHVITFNGFPESIPSNGSTYTISAICTQKSENRKNTFTLNISSKNNWRPGSATCTCGHEGKTSEVDCYVNTSNSFDEKLTSITITVDKVEKAKKEYYLSIDKSSITTDNNKFTVKSYYTQNSTSGETITIYAKCKDSDVITSKSITQESNSGVNGGVGFTVKCNGGETISPNSVLPTELSSDFTKEITVDEHPILGDTTNNVITVTQNDSGKTLTLIHATNSAVEHKYEYRIILFDNKNNVEDENNKTGISNITLSSSTTKTTIYARLEEKCTSVKDTGICEIGNDPMDIYKSYDYIVIKKEAVSHSGVKLSDFTNFTFNGEKWSKGDPVYSDSYITIELSGSVNNDTSSSTKYCSMDLLSDTTSTIPKTVCDKDKDAFWFKFSLNEETSTGGYTRTGTFLANYNDVAKAICNLSQTSSISSSSTSAPITGKSNNISLEFNPKGNFGKSRIEESNGEYTVYIKTLTDFYANSNPEFVEGLTDESDYEINVAEGITQDVTVNNYTESVKFKVVVKGNKYYTQYENNGSKITSRNVTVTASYKYNEETKSVITSTKTQNVCNKVDSTQKYEVSNPSVTWTASEQNTTLYTDYNPKSGVETTVSINSKISGSTSEDKKITFTATVNNTDKNKNFTITWPKTANISTSWTYTITIDISLTNSCETSNFYLSINGTKIDTTEVIVSSGSNNKIEYISEEITATEVKSTVKLYKNGTEIENYGENTFTITANTLSKSYSENCETEVIIFNINIISNTSYTVYPGTTVEIIFTITDSDANYYNFNDYGDYSIDNTNFNINDYISFNNNINTIKVTTSGINGDTATLTLSINDDDNKVTKNITITNK